MEQILEEMDEAAEGLIKMIQRGDLDRIFTYGAIINDLMDQLDEAGWDPNFKIRNDR